MNATTRYRSSREECIIIGTYSQRHLRPASQTENTRLVLDASDDASAPAPNTGHRTRLAISTRFAFQVCFHLSPLTGKGSPPKREVRTRVNPLYRSNSLVAGRGYLGSRPTLLMGQLEARPLPSVHSIHPNHDANHQPSCFTMTFD